MIKLRFGVLIAILITATSAFAGYAPGKVQAALKKMYPTANDIAWSQDDGYYCADFMMNGLEKNVWFNAQGQWAMTQTELVSTDRLSPAVYNAFSMSNYDDWEVLDVTYVEFPKWEPIIVIKVGQANIDIKYQLFYTPKGELLRTRNVSNMYDILGPGTFL
ncbi:PepSY-like domain-containing protein [Bacteroides sp.]